MAVSECKLEIANRLYKVSECRPCELCIRNQTL